MLGRTVAVKVLSRDRTDTETLRRFQNEAQSAARLDHANIARVYYVGEDQGLHYIVFEFIEGINLRDLLAREGALDELTVIVIGMCVASALHYAWEKSRLIHRDVKPENLLISKDGRLKLCDMGIAKRMVPQPFDGSLTRTGYVVGTPHYIAPEQLKGGKDLDCRVDIYALGATLYHAVTGCTVHQADSEFGLMIKHATVPVRDPREIRPTLSDAFAASATPIDWICIPSDMTHSSAGVRRRGDANRPVAGASSVHVSVRDDRAFSRGPTYSRERITTRGRSGRSSAGSDCSPLFFMHASTIGL
jgi:serine/threonine protein kinase